LFPSDSRKLAATPIFGNKIRLRKFKENCFFDRQLKRFCVLVGTSRSGIVRGTMSDRATDPARAASDPLTSLSKKASCDWRGRRSDAVRRSRLKDIKAQSVVSALDARNKITLKTGTKVL
jgi:hypothetical protein